MNLSEPVKQRGNINHEQSKPSFWLWQQNDIPSNMLRIVVHNWKVKTNYFKRNGFSKHLNCQDAPSIPGLNVACHFFKHFSIKKIYTDHKVNPLHSYGKYSMLPKSSRTLLINNNFAVLWTELFAIAHLSDCTKAAKCNVGNEERDAQSHFLRKCSKEMSNLLHDKA